MPYICSSFRTNINLTWLNTRSTQNVTNTLDDAESEVKENAVWLSCR